MNSSIFIKNKSYFIPAGKNLINVKVLCALIICLSLIIIGAIRILSYSRGSIISELVEDTIFYHFAYLPEDQFNVTFIKILATPSLIALIYFLLRGLNNKYIKALRYRIINRRDKVNFKPFMFRLQLIVMITLCWIPIELLKFYLKNEFYPYSSLEDPFLNFLILVVGGIITLVLMKYLPFEPLFTKRND